MQGRNWIILGVAVLVGLFAVILANAYFSGVEEKQAQIAKQQEMVQIGDAAQPLEFGTELSPQNIHLSWPATSVPKARSALPRAEGR